MRGFVIALLQNAQDKLLPRVVLSSTVHVQLVGTMPVRRNLLWLLVYELSQVAEVLLHEVVHDQEQDKWPFGCALFFIFT